MACCDSDNCSSSQSLNSPRWRRALWIALAINAGFFVIEVVAGAAAGSVSLQADALDFLGDAANYAISLGVAGMAFVWRARASLVKGATMAAFGACVLGVTAYNAVAGTIPDAPVMGVVGVFALAANFTVALMLYRFRDGDSNMRSVWICSRNDAIGNRGDAGRARRFRHGQWLAGPHRRHDHGDAGAFRRLADRSSGAWRTPTTGGRRAGVTQFGLRSSFDRAQQMKKP